MRVFFGLLFGLIIGIGAGIFADRNDLTRDFIDPYFEKLVDSETSVEIEPEEPEELAPLLELADGASNFSSTELANFGVEPCFPRSSHAAPDERPWLERDIDVGGFVERSDLSSFPDLSDYPGLIKIEGIRSNTGSQREHCAAARIREHWFLTAAHCIVDLGIDTARPTYDVIAVTPAIDANAEGIEVVSVTSALCHAAYGMNRQQYPNDVAVFYLEDVSAFEDVAIVEIETSDLALLSSDFANLYVSGWGKNGGTRYLQGGAVTMRELGEAVLITDRVGLYGPNVGDSGAPLYAKRGDEALVVGVLSQVTQDSDGRGDRGIYIRAKSIADWVDRTTRICEQDGLFLCHRTPVEDALDDQIGIASVAFEAPASEPEIMLPLDAPYADLSQP